MDEHIPVLLQAAVDALEIQPDGVYVDATLGRGGHAAAILARLGPNGRLLLMDRDPQAVAAGLQRFAGDARVTVLRSPFSQLITVLAGLGLSQVDGVLADLGVSSPQLDDPERGFSFRLDGPLDMRMDPEQGESAAQWLARASQDEIADVLRKYGEERFAGRVARAIVARRVERPIERTLDLAALVAQALPSREPGQHPATRSFQGIRIYLNRELAELQALLAAAKTLLKPGGRLAVISFHSLEDRLVKRFMRDGDGAIQVPLDLPIPVHALPIWAFRALGKAIRASAAETQANPRARSAVLRVAERRAERV